MKLALHQLQRVDDRTRTAVNRLSKANTSSAVTDILVPQGSAIPQIARDILSGRGT